MPLQQLSLFKEAPDGVGCTEWSFKIRFVFTGDFINYFAVITRDIFRT
jgi:hypothetical protein